MTELGYAWKDGQIHAFDLSSNAAAGFYGCYMVDTNWKTPAFRYGIAAKERWKYLPLKAFPKEFRAALLLLGVS